MGIDTWVDTWVSRTVSHASLLRDARPLTTQIYLHQARGGAAMHHDVIVTSWHRYYYYYYTAIDRDPDRDMPVYTVCGLGTHTTAPW